MARYDKPVANGKRRGKSTTINNLATISYPNKPSKEVIDNNFKKDYEFTKPHSNADTYHSAREKKWRTDKDSPYYNPREVAMLMREPHVFKHTKAKGSLRVSGTRGAHQLGKRSKAKAR
jgi:hypothetical protein